MLDITCTNTQRGTCNVLDLTNSDVDYLLGCTDAEIQEACVNTEYTVEQVRERFNIEKTRRELGI